MFLFELLRFLVLKRQVDAILSTLLMPTCQSIFVEPSASDCQNVSDHCISVSVSIEFIYNIYIYIYIQSYTFYWVFRYNQKVIETLYVAI